MSVSETHESQSASQFTNASTMEVDLETSVGSMDDALDCLADGKRHLLCEDIPAAVSSLAEACQLMAGQCGEKAPECGEAYYFYGKALLELARLENVVLGNALDGVPRDDDDNLSSQVENPDTMTDEERTEVQEKVDEALVENFDNCEISESPLLMHEASDVDATGTETVTGSGGPDIAEDEEIEDDSQDDEGLGADKCEHVDAEDAVVHETRAADEPSNLQLAWEVLELSKIICKEQLEGEKKAQHSKETVAALEKRYCDTYHLLSEVSVESGNYGQAVEDLKVCLNKQKELLPNDSRNVAETHYQLGVALGYNKAYDDALTNLECAISVIENRASFLKDQNGSEAKMEIEEIAKLIPEVKAKVADIIVMIEEAARKAAEVEHIEGKPDKPLSTIAVKRKSDEGLSEDIKKAKGVAVSAK